MAVIKRKRMPLMLLGALFIVGCFSGGGSDTETLTGRILKPDGTPSAGTEVKLIPGDYDPAHPDSALIRSTRTDAAGRYSFLTAPVAGSYNLLASDSSDGPAGLAVFAPALTADSLPKTLSLAKARVFYITLHRIDYPIADSGKAYFPGTDILIRCQGVAATRLNGVPLGLDRIILESRAGWRHDYQVTVPGDSLNIKANQDSVTVTPITKVTPL